MNITMWAACCLGFFAFLRSGEFTVPSAAAFDPAIHLTAADIAIDNHTNPSLLRVVIKQSKTDQIREGVALWVGRTNSDLCPVAGMLAYLAIRPSQDPRTPLFLLPDGQPLTRPFLVAWLKETVAKVGMDAARFSGHSFRIGAATTAAMQGIGDGTIQVLGRWKSDSYTRYIRIPRQELARISSTLAEDR